jgi:putative FmdB family regulatory protein
MPTYTYRCDNCGIQFDQQQHFIDPPLTRCPECGKKTLRKVYLPVGIVFKGSGFYATDHRSPSGAPRLTHEKENGEKTAEKTTDKSAAKSSEVKKDVPASTPTKEKKD